MNGGRGVCATIETSVLGYMVTNYMKGSGCVIGINHLLAYYLLIKS